MIRASLLGLLLAAPAFAAGTDYHLYVACESSDEVYAVRFDGKDAHVEEVITVGYQPTEVEGPHGLTVEPGGEHWYLSIAHGKPFGSLYKFRTRDNRAIAHVELGMFPATMQISEDTGLLYCVNFDLHGDMQPSTVSVVDPEEMIEVAQTVTGPMPHGSRLSSDGRLHYSCAMMSDELIELDAASFEVTRRLTLSDGTGRKPHRPGSETHKAVTKPTWVQPHPSQTRAYVCLNGAAQVVEVDLEDWRIRRRFPSAKGPYNLDLTPDGEALVVTHKGNASIGVWNLESGRERGRVATSRRITHGVVISPDGRYAFVSNEGIGSESGTLDVIDLESLELVTTLEMGLQAGGIAFWKMDSERP